MRRLAVVAAALLLGLALGFGLDRVSWRGAEASLPGPVDLGFAQAMIAHHDQAVLMAQIMLAHEAGGLGAVARSIETAQLLEIGQMRGWLALWGKPLLPSSRGMDWLLPVDGPPDPQLLRYLADCRAAAGGMPGLASSAQLDQLRQEEGAARDQLFLQLMLRHHQGALPMARYAAAHARLPAVRSLAAQIAFDQAGEILRMQQLLRAQDAAGTSKSKFALATNNSPLPLAGEGLGERGRSPRNGPSPGPSGHPAHTTRCPERWVRECAQSAAPPAPTLRGTVSGLPPASGRGISRYASKPKMLRADRAAAGQARPDFPVK